MLLTMKRITQTTLAACSPVHREGKAGIHRGIPVNERPRRARRCHRGYADAGHVLARLTLIRRQSQLTDEKSTMIERLSLGSDQILGNPEGAAPKRSREVHCQEKWENLSLILVTLARVK